MAEDKKYFWLKLKKDFFKRHDVMVIESMPNGKDYVLFYLKLLLESVDHEGTLRFNDVIPYNENMLAAITNTNIDIVRSSMKLFVELKLIEIMSDETIYMKEIENMMGSETYWAKKKREQREIGQCPTNVLQVSTMSKQDKEIEKEKELELEIETIPPIIPQGDGGVAAQTTNGSHEDGLPLNTDAAPKKSRRKSQEAEKKQYAEYVRMLEKEYQSLIDAVGGEENAKRCIEILDDYKGSIGRTYKDDYRAIRSWVIDRLREEQSRHRRYAPCGKKPEPPMNPQMAMAQRAIEMLGGMDDDAGSNDH